MQIKSILPFVAMIGLSACATTRPAERSYGNDALPSADVTAFQATDARLRYRDARIERDANGCAVYQGTAPDGQVKREALLDPAGKAICSR